MLRMTEWHERLAGGLARRALTRSFTANSTAGKPAG
jgi:hypothetical protein